MLALLFSSAPSFAEPLAEVRARAGTYQDDDHTSVTTLGARASVDPVPALRLKAGYLADIVSSASVDVVSAATPGFRETRHEAEGAATLSTDDLTAGASYRYSVERDWESHTIATRGLLELADDNTELGLSLSLGLNRVGRANDAHFSRRLTSYGYALSASQILDPKTLVGLVYDGGYVTGFQSSPYRYVATSDRRFVLLEHDPERRLRHALGAFVLRHLAPHTSVRGDYRFYLDGWGVLAHTAELRLTHELGPLGLSVHERFYVQRGAWFYARSYTTPREYMTRDRELSSFWDSFSGASLELELVRLGPLATLVADVAGDFFYYRFADFEGLDSRSGFTASAGLGGSF